MRNSIFFIFIVFFIPSITAQVIPNYGDLIDSKTSGRFIKSVRVGDHIAVNSTFLDEENRNAVFILNQQGFIETIIPTRTDSSFWDVVMYGNGDRITLMGFTGKDGLGIDSASLVTRKFLLQEYDEFGELLFEKQVDALPNDIGLLGASLKTGITADAVIYQNISRVGASSADAVVDVTETLIVEFDSTGNPDFFQGGSFISYFDRQKDTLIRRRLTADYGVVADLVLTDSGGYFYAGTGGNTSAPFRTIHFFDKNAKIISSTIDPNGYVQSGLSHYAEAKNGLFVEAVGLGGGISGQNIRATRLRLLDENRMTLEERIIADNEAPFGEGSLSIGIDNSIFSATVDVVRKDDLFIQIQKINAEDLSTIWSVSADNNDFGLYQSLVPTDDGGAIVFGTEKIAQRIYSTKVTKINSAGLTDVSQEYGALNSWIEGPNPTSGILYISPNAFQKHQNLSGKIYDLQGKLVRSFSVESTVLDVPGMNSGTYVVLILGEGNVVLDSKKIVFE